MSTSRLPRPPRRPVRALAVLPAVTAVLGLGACTPGTRAAPVASTPSSTSPPTAAPCNAAAAVEQWPLARRAAQVVVAPAIDGQVGALSSIVGQGIGGLLLIGSSVPPDLAAEITAADQVAPTPPFVMVDEEGGGVQRLMGLVPNLPWARQAAATMTPAQLEAAATGVGRAMRALGVDVDLAPVLDVDGGVGPNARDPDGLRSFSADPRQAAAYGVAFMGGLLAAGVTPVVKHFPGLGGSTGNTDYGPAATQPWTTLQTTGLPPFEAAISGGAPAVMVANATVPGLSPQPASLSRAVIETALRLDLGFHGLVITDSLSAGAISEAGYTLASAAVASIAAGADMVLFGSTLTPVQSPAEVAAAAGQITAALVGAVASGALPEPRLDQAVLDVLAAKHVTLC
jgi:beta-N-acetylhexosaminidase